jgi:H+/Cl- antiporter ClcA
MQTLTETVSDYTVWGLIFIVVVKLAALLVSSTTGFRGGRIFPAGFVGVAIGHVAHALDNDIPLALAIACGILGIVMVVARDWWMTLFLAVAIVGDVTLLPLLCIAILPLWLLVATRPTMVAPAVPNGAAT